MLLTGWMLSKSGWMLPFNNAKSCLYPRQLFVVKNRIFLFITRGVIPRVIPSLR